MGTEKHWAASVYVFGVVDGAWKIALLYHRKLDKWTVPGGHVEPDENPAEAAVREVREETGLDVTLRSLHAPWVEGALDEVRPVPLPEYIVEEDIAEHNGVPAHIHLDCLYFALADGTDLQHGPGESHQLGWYADHEMDGLDLFDATRRIATTMFAELRRKEARSDGE